MNRKYRKTALLASVAAIAGVSAVMAEVPAWLPQLSDQTVSTAPMPLSTAPTATTPSATPATPAPTRVASRSGLADGTYTGPTVNAYYGLVQVQVSIRNGRLVGIHVLQYPNDRRTSRYINSQALPMLKSEVIQAQSARVYGISGATLTSEAYLQSVGAALRKAGA